MESLPDGPGKTETSIPLRRGSRSRGIESRECCSTRRYLRSISRAQKNPHGMSASTRRAVIAAAALGGSRFSHGLSFTITTHLIFVDVLTVVLAEPRRVYDVFDPCFFYMALWKAD